MIIGFGLAFAIIAEYLRRRKLKFLEPGDWIVELVRESIAPIDETRLSNHEKQVRLIRRFIKSDSDLYGDESVHRVRNILYMSELMRSSGKIGEARDWLWLGIRLLEHNVDVGDARLSEAYLKMAAIGVATSDSALADCWFEKAIESLEKGGDFPGLALALRTFGDFQDKTGRADDALKTFSKELAVLEEILPPISSQLEDALSYHINFMRRANKIDAANKLDVHYRLILAVSTLESGAGEDCFYLARDLEKLGAYLQKREKPTSKLNAKALLERARILRLMERVKGDEYPGVIRDLEDVAEWLEKRNSGGDATVAFRMRRRAKLIKERQKDYRSVNKNNRW